MSSAAPRSSCSESAEEGHWGDSSSRVATYLAAFQYPEGRMGPPEVRTGPEGSGPGPGGSGAAGGRVWEGVGRLLEGKEIRKMFGPIFF